MNCGLQQDGNPIHAHCPECQHEQIERLKGELEKEKKWGDGMVKERNLLAGSSDTWETRFLALEVAFKQRDLDIALLEDKLEGAEADRVKAVKDMAQKDEALRGLMSFCNLDSKKWAEAEAALRTGRPRDECRGTSKETLGWVEGGKSRFFDLVKKMASKRKG